MYDATRQEGNAMSRFRKILVLPTLVAFFFVALLAGAVVPTLAQSDGDEWTTPLNLSSRARQLPRTC
jgi:hypothetical protein